MGASGGGSSSFVISELKMAFEFTRFYRATGARRRAVLLPRSSLSPPPSNRSGGGSNESNESDRAPRSSFQKLNGLKVNKIRVKFLELETAKLQHTIKCKHPTARDNICRCSWFVAFCGLYPRLPTTNDHFWSTLHFSLHVQ